MSKPSTRSPSLLLLLVAISGAASLACEVLWIRALGRHFGTTTVAVTTVVSTFMAGLGLGYVWFGARADRSPRPFALYQRLELCIAISGVIVSLLLLRGGSWLDALAQLCAAAGSASTACTAAVLALLMLLPTIAMGGTLPVLASALARGTPHGSALGLLYASNTLGAVVGALVPDFVTIPRHGMTFTACLAAAANLAVAGAAQRFVRAERGHAPADLLASASVGAPATRAAALVLSAGMGACALGLEVLWSRTLQHWAAALVTSFAVLLAVYLAALALGALLTQRLAARCRAPLSAACLLSLLTALGTLLPLWAAPAWRELARSWWPRPDGVRRVGLAHEAIDALLHAGFLELAPCLLMGAAFPFIAAAWLGAGRPGARTGQLFVVNTFAGVAGSLVVGFWWLPRHGEQWSYGALAVLLACVAALCAVQAARSERARPLALASALGLAGVLALGLSLPRAQLARAHFRGGGQLVALEEGATTSAAAARHFLYGEPYHLELLTPGISMSTTRADARRYMALMAHAAALGAHAPRRALLICYGVGNTASALLAHASLQRLDVADLSPEVLALSPHFAAERGSDPLRDPRTHVFIDDGRHHLVTHDTRYDVITAEPPPPNYAGVANLYSREFYRLARSRLAAGGVISQWLPVFQLSDDEVRAMIAAFVAELPHTALLYGHAEQLILLGSPDPLALETRSDEPLTRALQRDYIGGVDDVLGSVLQTDAELRRQVAGVDPLGDDRPSIQYPRQDVPEGTHYASHFARDASRALTLLAQPVEPALQQRVRTAWDATQRAVSAVPLRAAAPPEARELALGRLLAPALADRPEDQGLWSLLAIDSDRARLAERALAAPEAFGWLARPRHTLTRRERPRYLVLQDAAWMLARRAFYTHEYRRALALLERIDPEPAEASRYALLRAGCLRALGRADESAQAFRDAAARSSDRGFCAHSLALAQRTAAGFEPAAGPWQAE